METIAFPEQTVIIAENQPEYLPMPAYYLAGDPTGLVICCWSLNWKERIRMLFSGRIWHQVLTFNHPLQPQLLSVGKPEMLQSKEKT